MAIFFVKCGLGLSSPVHANEILPGELPTHEARKTASYV